MTTRDVLLKEIQQVPEPLLQEVLDFIPLIREPLMMPTYHRREAIRIL